MKLINIEQIKEQLNNCYDSYDPHWPYTIGQQHTINAFKYHLEQEGGLKLDFEVQLSKTGQAGYKINSAEVVDEPAFMMWMLKWA